MNKIAVDILLEIHVVGKELKKRIPWSKHKVGDTIFSERVS